MGHQYGADWSSIWVHYITSFYSVSNTFFPQRSSRAQTHQKSTSSTSNNDLSKWLQQNARKRERDETAQIARIISEWEFTKHLPLHISASHLQYKLLHAVADPRLSLAFRDSWQNCHLLDRVIVASSQKYIICFLLTRSRGCFKLSAQSHPKPPL